MLTFIGGLMYPNYKAITGIESEFLRVALYTARDEELRRLQATFPECFSENVEDLCVPASHLRDLAEQFSRSEDFDEAQVATDRETWWAAPLENLGAPIAFSWSGTSGDDIPEVILAQLRGRPLTSGMTIEYLGEKFLLGFICSTEKIRLGKILVINRKDEISITLIHAKFVDLEH